MEALAVELDMVVPVCAQVRPRLAIRRLSEISRLRLLHYIEICNFRWLMSAYADSDKAIKLTEQQ